MKFDTFVPFGRPHSGTIIIQLMIELNVLITKYRNSYRKQSNALIFSAKIAYFENINGQ